jgi:hypothetical protein
MSWTSFFAGYLVGVVSVSLAVVFGWMIHYGSLDTSHYVVLDDDVDEQESHVVVERSRNHGK